MERATALAVLQSAAARTGDWELGAHPSIIEGEYIRRRRWNVSTRILFVRAVNVGGARLPMGEFRDLLADLGASKVRTYIASGNAVLDVDGNSATFDRRVEKAITDRYGFVREVISRTPGEVIAALKAHPFEVVEPKFSYLSFLTAEPTADAIESARSVATGADSWEVIGTELHARFADGLGNATLNLDTVLRRLKIAGTARNLRTVQALIELAG
jgi:uncharacterized protein (DUF1697 family)